MGVNFSSKRFPLSLLTSTTDFVVCSQRLFFNYENNKQTNEVAGVRLEVHDSKLCDRFSVKIPGMKELPFEDSRVENLDIHVSLVNPTFSLYVKEEDWGRDRKRHVIAFSVTVDSVKEITKSGSKTQTISNIDSVL